MDLLLNRLLHRFGIFFLLQLFFIFFHGGLPSVLVSQLFLDDLDLFPKIIIALQLFHLLVNFRTELMLNGQDFQFMHKNRIQSSHPIPHIDKLQHRLLVFHGQIQMAGNQIR